MDMECLHHFDVEKVVVVVVVLKMESLRIEIMKVEIVKIEIARIVCSVQKKACCVETVIES
jgi:hypothetical protein